MKGQFNMSLFKKLIPVAILALILMHSVVFADDNVNVVIGDTVVEFGDQTPVIIDGRTFVPLRAIFESMGFVVAWDNNTASLMRQEFAIEIGANSYEFILNGTSHSLETPAQIINNRIMLPLRELLESMTFDVAWDELTQTIKITTPPEVQTIAGTGAHGYNDGSPSQTQFNLPMGVFSTNDGTIFVTDTYNNLIRRIDTNGITTTIAGEIQGDDEFGFPLGRYREGNLSQALFNRPTSGVIAADGTIFISDSGNHIIRKITPYGHVYTFASETDEEDDETAVFYHPMALAFAPDGSIVFADTLNHVIRKVDMEGNATTIAGIPGVYGFNNGANDEALFNTPMGIAVDKNGVIFVADTGNHLIRVIQDGFVSTLAGTLLFPNQVAWVETAGEFDDIPIGGFADGFEAMFDSPIGLALWNDILIIADSSNHRIRAVLPSGEVITLAGTGYPDGNSGVALFAAFQLPQGVYVLGDMLYIADTGNNLIRVLPLN